MATIKFVLRPPKYKSETEYPLFMRIQYKGETRYVSLEWKIDPNQWDKKEGRPKETYKQRKWLNNKLKDKRDKVDEAISKIDTKKEKVTAKKIKDVIANKPIDDFYSIADKYINSLPNESSKPGRKSIIKKLKSYNQNKPLYFDEIDVKFLRDFQQYLRNKYKNGEGTIQTATKLIRAVYNYAADEEIVRHNPTLFKKVMPKVKPSDKVFLTESELDKLYFLKMDDNTMLNQY